MKLNYCDILVINRNNTKLTNMVLKSIIKNVVSFDYHIYVVDNSDKDMFLLSDEVSKYNSKITLQVNQSNDLHDKFGSIGHARTIQKFIDTNKNVKNLLIVESDAIVIHDIDFLDDSVIAAGKTFFGTNLNIHGNECTMIKIVPCFMYLNADMMRRINLKYLNDDVQQLAYIKSGIIYDTGSNFYANIISRNMQIKNIRIETYVNHLLQMSTIDKNGQCYKDKMKLAETLTDYSI